MALRQCPCAFLMTLRASLTLCLLLCEAGQHWTPGRVLQQRNGSRPPEGLARFPTTEPIPPTGYTHWRFPPEEDSPRAELGSRKEGFRGPFQPAGPGRWSVPQLGSAAGWRPPPTALAVGAGDREAGGGFGPPHPSAPQLRSRHTCRSPPLAPPAAGGTEGRPPSRFSPDREDLAVTRRSCGRQDPGPERPVRLPDTCAGPKTAPTPVRPRPGSSITLLPVQLRAGQAGRGRERSGGGLARGGPRQVWVTPRLGGCGQAGAGGRSGEAAGPATPRPHAPSHAEPRPAPPPPPGARGRGTGVARGPRGTATGPRGAGGAGPASPAPA